MNNPCDSQQLTSTFQLLSVHCFALMLDWIVLNVWGGMTQYDYNALSE